MLYLFLNSISTGEVVVILIFILMFFGSKNIPSMARTFGKGLRQIRDASDDIKRDIRNSMDDIKSDVDRNMNTAGLNKEVRENVRNFKSNVEDVAKEPAEFIKKKSKEFTRPLHSTPERKESKQGNDEQNESQSNP